MEKGSLGNTQNLRIIAELEFSADIYRAVFAGLSEGVVIRDVSGKIISCNNSAGKILDIDPKELIGRKSFALSKRVIHEDGSLYTQEERPSVVALETEKPTPLEIRGVYRPDGSLVWISGTTDPLFGKDGSTIGVVTTFRDVTNLKEAEEKLRKKEEMYRSLFDNMLNGFAFCQMHFDEEGKPCDFTYLVVNEAFTTLTGLVDVIGKKVSEIIPNVKETAPELLERYGRVSKNGAPESFEIFIEPLKMWFDISVYCPKFGFFAAIFNVTTKRKQAEKKLQDSNTFNQALVQTIPLYIDIVDEECKVLYANWRLEKLIGEEVVGKKCWHSYKDNKKQCITCPLKQPIEVGVTKTVETEGVLGGRVFEITHTGMIYNSKKALMEIFTDITEQKNAAKTLFDSESRFRSIFNGAMDGIALSEVDGRKFLTANSEFCRMLGYTEEEILHLGVEDIHPKEVFPTVMLEFGRMVRGEISLAENLPVIRKDGHIFYADIKAAAINIQGKPCVLGIVRDTTEKKKLSEEAALHLKQIESAMFGTVKAICDIIERRDPYTAGHEKRVAHLMKEIGSLLGLSEKSLKGLETVGLLHDVGKIAIPAEILSKPTKLNAMEKDMVKIHSQVGFDLMKDVSFPWPVAEVVLQHHERLDGSGYPNGLKGDQICLEARILSVADVVEAMSSHRPYRPGLGVDAALEEIIKNRGKLYDERVVDACLQLFEKAGDDWSKLFE